MIRLVPGQQQPRSVVSEVGTDGVSRLGGAGVPLPSSGAWSWLLWVLGCWLPVVMMRT